MDKFNHRKWFKKQYLEEGMSDKKVNESMLQSQFEDLHQVVRNIYHVGEYKKDKEGLGLQQAAFDALQSIGEEFGVNFEEGRF